MQKITESVQLGDPSVLPAPAPIPGCDVCSALTKQWRQASDVGSPAFDRSHATDLAVEISRHPHARRVVK